MSSSLAESHMNDPKLIRPDIRSTPGWRRLLGKRGQAMPDDLLKEASERLGITALIVAMLWLLGTILDHVALHIQAPGSNRWISWEVR